jgi:hypothetical protein
MIIFLIFLIKCKNCIFKINNANKFILQNVIFYNNELLKYSTYDYYIYF